MPCITNSACYYVIAKSAQLINYRYVIFITYDRIITRLATHLKWTMITVSLMLDELSGLLKTNRQTREHVQYAVCNRLLSKSQLVY